MYRLCVCACVYIRSADINDDYTHQQKMSEFLVRNGSKRPHERNLREMFANKSAVTRGHVVCFFFLHKLERKFQTLN